MEQHSPLHNTCEIGPLRKAPTRTGAGKPDAGLSGAAFV